MEVIVNFVKWFTEQKTRAIALVFMIALFIGMGGIIYYQHKQAVKNDEISKRIDREYQLDIRNIINRCDSINRVREVEIYEINKQHKEIMEKVYNDYRDLYLKSQELKSRY
jgi:chromosome segregation and condensation protein ScpB